MTNDRTIEVPEQNRTPKHTGKKASLKRAKGTEKRDWYMNLHVCVDFVVGVCGS